MPFHTVVLGLLAAFAVSLISGLTGFGMGLVASPLLVLVLPPRVVVPLLTLHALLANIVLILDCRKWLSLDRVWLLMLCGVAAVPAGTYVLVVISGNVLKVLMGVVASLSALAFLLGFKKQVRNEKLASIPIGLASGLLSGSMAMGGLPVVLFLANQEVEKQTFRANLALFFLALKAIAIPSQWMGGLYTREVLTYVLLLLPGVLLGLFAGCRLAGRVAEEPFRIITLIMVGVAGMLSVTAGLGLI